MMNRNDLTVPLRLLGVSLVLVGLLYQGSLMAIGSVAFPNNAAGVPSTSTGRTRRSDHR